MLLCLNKEQRCLFNFKYFCVQLKVAMENAIFKFSQQQALVCNILVQCRPKLRQSNYLFLWYIQIKYSNHVKHISWIF